MRSTRTATTAAVSYRRGIVTGFRGVTLSLPIKNTTWMDFLLSCMRRYDTGPYPDSPASEKWCSYACETGPNSLGCIHRLTSKWESICKSLSQVFHFCNMVWGIGSSHPSFLLQRSCCILLAGSRTGARNPNGS